MSHKPEENPPQTDQIETARAEESPPPPEKQEEASPETNKIEAPKAEEVLPPPYPPDYEAPPINSTVISLNEQANSEAVHINRLTSFYYNLYDIDYRAIPITEWKSIEPDPHPYISLWHDQSAFTPENFFHSITCISEIQHPFFSLLFLLNSLSVFIVFIIAAAKAESLYTGSYMTKAVGYSFLISIVYVLYDLLTVLIMPSIYVRFGVILGLAVSVASLIAALVCKSYWSIAFFIITLIFFTFFLPFSSMGKDFSLPLLKYASRIIFTIPRSLGFIILELILMSLVSVLYMYTAFCSIVIQWDNFFIAYLMWSYWWTVVTLGNCIYMAKSLYVASTYFLKDTNFLGQITASMMLKRCLFYNFGSAAYAAICLPIIEICRSVAMYSPKDVISTNPESVAPFNKGMAAIVNCIRPLAIAASRKFDVNGQLSRQGLVYCGMFGISIEDGSKRWAEQSATKYINLLMQESNIDTIMMDRKINTEISSGYVSWVAAYPLNSFGAGFGFFLAYALSHILQSHYRGIIESLIVCFGEMPENEKGIDKEVADDLRASYPKIVERRIAQRKPETNV